MNISEPIRGRVERFQRLSLFVGIAGLALCVLGAIIGKEQFFRSYLFAYVFWVGFPLGAFGLYMLHHLVGGAWGFVIRRLLSAAMRTLPLMAVLFIPIVFGIEDLYPWARPEAATDHILKHKEAYLNVPFFLIRTAIYFAVWIFWSFIVFRLVRRLEETGDLALIRRMQNISAGGLLLLVLTVTLASIDWMMSLEPKWFSTIFGVIIIVGYVLATFAGATILTVQLGKVKPLSDVLRPRIYHDLGNFMFGFTIFWAYVSFMQFLIIYAGNLAEETPWYAHRLHGGWEWIGVALLVLHFVVPFMVLLSRNNKRNLSVLTAVAVFLLVMRAVDLYWIVMPSFYQDGLHLHWLDLAALAGIGGVWIWTYFWQLKQRPLLFTEDPRMRDALARVQEADAHERVEEPIH